MKRLAAGVVPVLVMALVGIGCGGIGYDDELLSRCTVYFLDGSAHMKCPAEIFDEGFSQDDRKSSRYTNIQQPLWSACPDEIYTPDVWDFWYADSEVCHFQQGQVQGSSGGERNRLPIFRY